MIGALKRFTFMLLGLLAVGPALGAEPPVDPAQAVVPAAAADPVAAPVAAPVPAAGAAPAGAAPAAGEAPAPQDPKALAKSLFDQIRQADTYDLATIERLYLEVMEKCPETEQAQESYWRMSNLYLQAYDAPKYPEARALLERFLARYPDSEGVPLVKRRLVFVYEEMKDWPKAVELYGELFAGPEVPPEVLEEYGFSYAQALKNVGRAADAKVWYKRFLDAMKGQDDFRCRVAEADLKELEGGGGAAAPAGDAAVAPAPAAAAPAAAPAAPPPAAAPAAPTPAAAALLAAPAAADGADGAQATRLQRDGEGLQGAGDYLGALQAYRQSQALRPDPQVAARVKKLEAYLKTRGIDVPPAP